MTPERIEYSHPDDFDRESAVWVPVTVQGSRYEVELDVCSVSSKFRHRDYHARGPWMPGRAPEEN